MVRHLWLRICAESLLDAAVCKIQLLGKLLIQLLYFNLFDVNNLLIVGL